MGSAILAVVPYISLVKIGALLLAAATADTTLNAQEVNRWITILILTFILRVDSGTVLVGGTPVTEQTTEQLMGQLSMVFQDVYLFDDTLEANVAVDRAVFAHPAATTRIESVIRTIMDTKVEFILLRLEQHWPEF